MNWIRLNHEEDLRGLNEISKTKLCLLFKYSTRCASSSLALDRLEREWNPAEMSEVQPYFLDLITYRALSDRIADQYEVRHESPQILLIENGTSIFDTSHYLIRYENIRKVVVQNKPKSES